MSTYADAVKMTPEELHNHPEVEMCACAHPRGLHRDISGCRGGYAGGVPCECVDFSSTGLRLKNSLVFLKAAPDYGVQVNPGVTSHRRLFFSYDPTDAEVTKRDRADYNKHVLSKIWQILADGERALDPDADPEYDTNDVYDLVRKGAEARKKLADGERQIAEFLEKRTGEAAAGFDVVIKAVAEAVESCAKIAEEYWPNPVPIGGPAISWTEIGPGIAAKIRSGK